jgi:hypothetical protein
MDVYKNYNVLMKKFCGICFDRLLGVVVLIAIPIIIIWFLIDFVRGMSVPRQRIQELNKSLK